jgi:hypothetical protein
VTDESLTGPETESGDDGPYEDAVDSEFARVLPIRPPASANRIPQKYRGSVGASMLAAGLLGLRDIIEPSKDDKPVIEQHGAESDRKRPIEVYLDPDDPSASLIVIRNPADDN